MLLQFIVKLMPLLLLYIREMSSRIPYIHSEMYKPASMGQMYGTDHQQSTLYFGITSRAKIQNRSLNNRKFNPVDVSP